MSEILWHEMNDKEKIWHLLFRIEALERKVTSLEVLVKP